MTSPSPDKLYNFWFTLKAAAERSDWDDMRAQLQSHQGFEIGLHPFNTAAFHRAAKAGQTDIVRAFFDRGHTVSDDRGTELVDDVIRYGKGDVAGTIDLLVREKNLDASRAVYSIAARGDIDKMKMLASAGASMFQLSAGSGFVLSLYSGYPEMMTFLYDHGASVYHPPAICALYSRRGEIDALPRAADVRRTYAALLERDRLEYDAIYQKCGGAPGSFADFTRKPQAEPAFSLLHIAARAGRFDDAARLLAAENAAFKVEDLVSRTEDSGVPSVVGILAARGELPRLFAPELWQKNPKDLEKLHESLALYGARGAIDLAGAKTAVLNLSLRRTFRPRGLKPRGL